MDHDTIEAPRAGIGHNRSSAAGPVDRTFLLDPGIITDDLADAHGAIASRVAELVAAAVRAFAKAAGVAVIGEADDAPAGASAVVRQGAGKSSLHLWKDGAWSRASETPARIMQLLAGQGARVNGEDEAERLISFVAHQLKPAHSSFEDARVAEKAPYDKASKAVQDWFKPRLDELAAATRAINELLLDPYRRAVELAERKRRQEEADRLRREAQEALAAAEAAKVDHAYDEAVKAGEAADRAVAATAAKPADVSRVRSNMGGVMTTRTEWRWRIVDAALIPREYLVVDEAALNAVARNMKDKAAVPGVQFYADTKTAVRR